MMSQTVSLWAHIMSAADEFQNPSYHPSIEQEVVHIQAGRDSTVQWWYKLYVVGECAVDQQSESVQCLLWMK